MQKLMGLVRRCVDDYHMIEAGDRIAVGVSGGKDSLALLILLAGLREYFNKPYELEAITIDMGLGMDYSQVAALCEEWKVPYTVVKTEIAPIIFDHRKEKNPCSMCAKMRRGALNQAILDKGFNKLALGHHYDDAVETFLMSLLFEGRINCFQPVTNLDRTGHRADSPHAVHSRKDAGQFRGADEPAGAAKPLSCGQDHEAGRGQAADFRAEQDLSRSEGADFRRHAALPAGGVGAEGAV